MQLLAFGLNHNTAPVALRERAAFGPETLPPALRELTAGGVREAAILSTCNRTEIYCGQSGEDAAPPLLDWLGHRTGLGRAELGATVYQLPGEHAVRHAFRVASGLDSMVLGEPQILGQMKTAFARAAALGATGKVLNRLFQHTFSVAKQVRTDTTIGTNSVSVACAGVDLAKRVFSHLSEQRALLIGAGETIELVARHLRDSGIGSMVIANRSPYKARAVARAAQGTRAAPPCEVISLGQIPAHLAAADLVVSSTASTLPILGKGAVEGALRQRRHKPMCILDLAVPRDVEAEVGQLPDVYLYTVDDLQSTVAQHRNMRAAAAAEAEILIDLQVVRFMRWLRALETLPTVRTLRDRLDAMRQAELDKALARLQRGAAPEEVATQLAHALTNKFAHPPSRALHQAGMESDPRLVNAARKLFDL